MGLGCTLLRYAHSFRAPSHHHFGPTALFRHENFWSTAMLRYEPSLAHGLRLQVHRALLRPSRCSAVNGIRRYCSKIQAPLTATGFPEHWALRLVQPPRSCDPGCWNDARNLEAKPHVLAQGRFRILVCFKALKVLHYISELATELETSTRSHLYQNASRLDSGGKDPSRTGRVRWCGRANGQAGPKPSGTTRILKA